MTTADSRWRHPFQVVRWTGEGAYEVVSSHRYEITASWWARLRDRLARNTDTWHDVRATPEREETR